MISYDSVPSPHDPFWTTPPELPDPDVPQGRGVLLAIAIGIPAFWGSVIYVVVRLVS
jgi:hypothetical protein